MDCYINLHFRADEEVPIYFIRNKVFTKFHKALHDQQQTSIGVSFPNYNINLGDVIRLHGEQAKLQFLQQKHWLGGLAGYCEVSNILPVPDRIVGYRTVSRVRQNMANSKLRRLIKRGSISDGEVKNYKTKMLATGLNNPYLELQSKTTGAKYRIYIAFGDIHEQATMDKFNQFGLSKLATVPWF